MIILMQRGLRRLSKNLWPSGMACTGVSEVGLPLGRLRSKLNIQELEVLEHDSSGQNSD